MKLQEIFKPRVLLVVGIVVAFLVFAFKIYGDYARAKRSRADIIDASNRVPDGGNREVTLILFFADWCPACAKCEGEWNAFHASFHEREDARIGGFRVSCQTVDCSNYARDPKAVAWMDKYSISAFPSVVLVGAGERGYQRMRGTITRASLESFVAFCVGARG